MIRFVYRLHRSLKNKGYEVPEISALILNICDSLNAQGLNIEIDDVFELFEKYSENYTNCFWHNKYDRLLTWTHIAYKKDSRHKQRPKISGRMAIGLCKIMGGALCCVIPHPAATGVGVALVSTGVQDITKELIQLDNENRQRQIAEGKPVPPGRFPPDYFDR